MAKNPNPSELPLQWFFDLATSEKARVIGLLLSASVFTWNVLTAIVKAWQDKIAQKVKERDNDR